MTRKVLDESMVVDGVTVVAEPLELELDPRELGRGPAAAIAEAITRDIAAIASPASPATVARRRRDGISGTRKFNATGELARSVTTAAAGDGYAISTLALREPAMDAELEQLVPALRAPLADADVQRALERADDQHLKVGKGGE